MRDDAYAALEPAMSLAGLLRGEADFLSPPDDWCVATCDIAGSTRAIAEGRYRDVNIVGVGFITGLMNVWRPERLAFAFGGDGAFALLPPERRTAAEAVCRETARVAKDAFGLRLRTGVFTIHDLCAQGARLMVGKVRSGKRFPQAAFSGGAASVADTLMKGREEASAEASAAPAGGARYDGLTCPWRPVRVEDGVIASLIVDVVEGDWAARHRRYADLIDLIGVVQGRDTPVAPLDPMDLRASFEPAQREAVARLTGAGGRMGAARMRERLSAFLAGATSFLPNWRRDAASRVTAESADYLRFDDVLRSTLRLSHAQKADLEAALAQERDKGDFDYGLAFSDAAMVTCILKSEGTHVALIDGAGGGYASAAAMLKAQRRKRSAA